VRAHPEAAACLLGAVMAARTASTAPAAGSSGIVSPEVVLEMLAADQQPVVDGYRAAHPEVADGLGAALKWWETGWPAWSVYLPLIEQAWRTRSILRAGDMAKAASPLDERQLSQAFGKQLPVVRASWAAAMKAAHCDLIDDAKASELATRQASRDVAMAAAVSTVVATQRPVLLYAGRAHVRSDRAVGLLLGARHGKNAPVTVALQETAEAGVPIDRAKVLAEARGRYDYVWLTGVAEQPGACDRLRARGLLPAAVAAGAQHKAGGVR